MLRPRPDAATGGSLGGTVEFLVRRGADHITCLCILAAPEGIENFRKLVRDLDVPCHLIVAGLDDHLDEHGYIVPGWVTPATVCTAWRNDYPAPSRPAWLSGFTRLPRTPRSRPAVLALGAPPRPSRPRQPRRGRLRDRLTDHPEPGMMRMFAGGRVRTISHWLSTARPRALLRWPQSPTRRVVAACSTS
ncbi:MaoC like domain [Cutibacterium acnes JCM 18918]|nr:MaoC like domain [Cutibacterium acnes JCM 18918]